MTTQQFLKNKGDADFRLSKSGEYISDIMIEFAKLHVEAALKEASNVLTVDNDGDYINHPTKDSILNAYPLTNIE